MREIQVLSADRYVVAMKYFLRDLIKTSRQRPHHVRWKDRDGVERVTTLSPTDAARLNTLAHELHLAKDALLHQATHLPAKPAKPPAQ